MSASRSSSGWSGSGPFCRVISFDRVLRRPKAHPKLLIVAPMSGHYATLLRGTVEAFLPTHQVCITDWIDARLVPLASGSFDLDDYIDYLISMIRALGPDLHILAVCQPSVPVVAAVARMEAENDPFTPRSMTLMGGPIDTRRSPTAVNLVAEERGIDWFKRNCIVKVPPAYPGFWRDVYPGFLQLSGFMAMNIDRHMNAHYDMFKHLVEGRRRLGREAPGFLRRISRGDGSHRRVLPCRRSRRSSSGTKCPRAK